MPEVIFGNEVLDIGERQLEVLQARGIVQRTLNGEGWVGSDVKLALQAMIEAPDSFICDFCSSSYGVAFMLETDEFEMATSKLQNEPVPTTHLSMKNWACCEKCGLLIRAGKWDELRARCVHLYIESMKDEGIEVTVATVAVVEMVIGDLQKRVLANWNGRIRRI